jgi:hypothetical protein
LLGVLALAAGCHPPRTSKARDGRLAGHCLAVLQTERVGVALLLATAAAVVALLRRAIGLW